LALSVAVDQPRAGAEIRGRLMGPTCLYSTTVEIAYPLRPARFENDFLPAHSTVAIPEPSWWDPLSPFLYAGPIELWEEGQKVEQIRVQTGLRHLQVRDHHLVLNGKPIPLRGVVRTTCSEEEMARLRAAGVNLLVAPFDKSIEVTWAIADAIGMLVIGRLGDSDPDPKTIHSLLRVPHHPSALGVIIKGGPIAGIGEYMAADIFAYHSRYLSGQFMIAVEPEETRNGGWPDSVTVVAGSGIQPTDFETRDLPRLAFRVGDTQMSKNVLGIVKLPD
jgi:hypothetical protein